MYFDIDRQTLLTEVKIAGLAIRANQINPIISAIKINVEKDKVTLSSTDLDYSIRTSLGCMSCEPGACLVPFKLFYQILNVLPDGLIHIELIEKNLNITFNDIHFKISVFTDVDSFPEFPNINTTQEIILPFDKFACAVNCVAPFTRTDDTNPILRGVNVVIKDKLMELSATDAYRIMIAKEQLDNKIFNEFNCVIPAEFLSHIANLNIEEDENLTIGYSENQIIVNVSHYQFVQKRINGKYPVFGSVIPSFEDISTLNVADFLSALNRQAIMENQNSVVSLKFDNGNLFMETKTDMGTAKDQIQYLGSPMTSSSYNTKWLIQGLRQFREETVMCVIKDNKSPCVLSDEDHSLIYLILPVVPGSNDK